MRKRVAIIVLSAIILVIAAAVAVRVHNREPEFEGRPLHAWLNDMQRGQPEAKVRAVEVLQKAGPEAAPFLARRLARKPGILNWISAKFGGHVPQRIRASLARIYSPNREYIDLYAAAEALRVIGTNGQVAAPTLGLVLADGNGLLSVAASRALAEMGPSAVEPLTRALDSGDYVVRGAACDGLAELRTNAAPAVPRLVKILRTEIGPITHNAAWALGKIGEAAAAALIPLLSDPNWMTRRVAAQALGYAGGDARTALPDLLVKCRDEHPQVRTAVMGALAQIDPTSRESAAALVAAIDDSDASVRSAALQALRTRPRNVRENTQRVAALLNDPAPEVRGYAALALSAAPAEAKSSLPRLEELTQDTNRTVQLSAAEALNIIRLAEQN